ncbi:MAG: hypothetical protein ACJAW3_001001, partial [Lentimonas sp.]
VNINSGDDAAIKGADILAGDVTINTGNNLIVESLQNRERSKSKSQSANVGGGGDSVSFGFNSQRDKFERDWVDDQTSIIGTNSIAINTGEDTNIKGAIVANISNATADDITSNDSQEAQAKQQDWIDGGNLAINTKTLTTENIIDIEKKESEGFGVQVSNLGIGSSKSETADGGTANSGVNTSNGGNPSQEKAYFPEGATTLSAQSDGYEKEQLTKATIGEGAITTDSTQTFDADGNFISATGGTLNDSDSEILKDLNRDVNNTQEITKDTITGALDFEVTIDHRLLSSAGRSEIAKEVRNLPKHAEAFIDVGTSVALAGYDYFTPSDITDPEIISNIRNEVRKFAVAGEKSELRSAVKELTGKTPTSKEMDAIIELSTTRNFAQLQEDIGNEVYGRFLDKYTKQTGIFFDGTNNKKSRDEKIGAETNVARMLGVYDSDAKVYVTGVGTSENYDAIDKLCQATGCGIVGKQEIAREGLIDILKNPENSQVLFFPVDVTGFSRGATTAMDFINKIDNENYWSQGVMTRSAFLFDPVASYGKPGNNIDMGFDFSLPENIAVMQINAADEKRANFPLQALRNSDGTLKGKFWTEITLPGVHSTIGGGYVKGFQGKDQNMAFYTMQTMVNAASNYGIKYNDIPENQRPTAKFNNLMNSYNQAKDSYDSNPNLANQVKFNSLEAAIKKSSVHDSSYEATGEWPNYSFGDRNVYNPND